MGLCVEMTAGSARSPPSCRVGEERWRARESRPPSTPSPRLHISTHRWRSGVCTTPDSRTHEEERNGERAKTLLNPHPCCHGVKFDGPTDIGIGVGLAVVDDRSSIPSAVTDNTVARFNVIDE